MINKCFGGNCKWRADGVPVCTHKNAVKFAPIKEPCTVCGRKPADHVNGCGACIGRGTYIYPFGYDDCDCGGYEKRKP